MLYLPVQLISKAEIRLPAFADDLISLCALFPENHQFEQTVRQLFRRSPGLFLYAANHFQLNQSERLISLGQLSQWIQRRMFDSSIESDAFEHAEISNSQLTRLLAWQEKPTQKRLAKYLNAVSDLGKTNCKKLVGDWFKNVIDFAELESTLIHSNSGFTDNSMAALPIRSMWLMCAKIQRLQSDFSLELRSQKLAAMKQLAYGASHEINNPLANIATRAQTLLAEETQPSKQQKLSVIYAQAMRAHEMISDMMLFAHPPELDIETVDVVSLIQDVALELRRKFKLHQIKFAVREYPGVKSCALDRTQFAVALKAMFENSIEAIGSAGEIRVQVWNEDDQLGIGIVDTGAGIDRDDCDKLFDPFFSGREAGRGLGFGLSKAWRIAELHGGTLQIDDQHSGGARLVMRLPTNQEIGQKKHSRIDNVRAA